MEDMTSTHLGWLISVPHGYDPRAYCRGYFDAIGSLGQAGHAAIQWWRHGFTEAQEHALTDPSGR